MKFGGRALRVAVRLLPDTDRKSGSPPLDVGGTYVASGSDRQCAGLLGRPPGRGLRDAGAGAGPRLPHARLPGRGLDVDPGRCSGRATRQAGWPRDFLDIVRSIAPYWRSGGRCRVITNAGGLNPLACARACSRGPAEAGCAGRTIAVVSGDDVLDLIRAGSVRRTNCCGTWTPASRSPT